MPHIAKKYLRTHPWILEERGFHPERNLESESIFTLANEYMGLRGYLEETYSGESRRCSFLNGLFETDKHNHPLPFRGMAEDNHYLPNALDWLHCRIFCEGQELDLARVRFRDFWRRLDMRRGILERSLVWVLEGGRELELRFERLCSMERAPIGCQRIVFRPLNFSGRVRLELGLDFNLRSQAGGRCVWVEERREKTPEGWIGIQARIGKSGQRAAGIMRLGGDAKRLRQRLVRRERYVGARFELDLRKGAAQGVERLVALHKERRPGPSPARVWKAALKRMPGEPGLDFDSLADEQARHWDAQWARADIRVQGDNPTQQGIRACLFHLHQTYQGADPWMNVPAKGLSGEGYKGVTWWDTETYCLPFYVHTHRAAARSLVRYRHLTLPGALERARQLDAKGARYPMCTLTGEELCEVWLHGDCEIHVSAAIAYGVWLYWKLSGDDAFLFGEGADILVEVARFYDARGDYGSKTGKFGFFAVMGADEMHAMVNNNSYTNFMAKRAMEFAAETVERIREQEPERYRVLCRERGLDLREVRQWQKHAADMDLPQDRKTGVFEQHEGYFNLPHKDYRDIPAGDFPLAMNWAYVNLFRYDLIKQPDVLLMMFLHGSSFSDRERRANFEYYEPRCCHGSSLSPAIHGILAAEHGQLNKAQEYSGFAARLDLDNYNNNTQHGLHITSMASVWMMMVQGWGGMRADGELMEFNPALPPGWKGYSFRVLLPGEAGRVELRVDRGKVRFELLEGPGTTVRIYGRRRRIGPEGLELALPVGAAE